MKTDSNNSNNTIEAEVLVIGGGGAGMRASIEARERGADVLVVSQPRVGYGCNTAISGGGFAAVLDPTKIGRDLKDSAGQHLHDTVIGGRSVNDQPLTEIMARGAEQQVEDLRRFGVKYLAAREGPWLAVTSDAGHSRSRLVNGQNQFGTDFTFHMREHAIKQGVRFLEGILITKLLKRSGEVVGAMGVNARGEVFVFAAPVVVLTCGGLGQVYLRNDNVGGATGDGYGLAYEAGVPLKDMEFVQFYPVALGNGTPELSYESLLVGSGGRLLNNRGEDIILKHGLDDPMLLTRDRLSQVIINEVFDGHGEDGKVVLDLAAISPERMEIFRPILPKGALRGERRFLVAPTVHFQMGGVVINEKGETCVPGLLAAGEVCGGVHGSNRLSGNALTEAWVFGAIAGREAALRAKEAEIPSLPAEEIAAESGRLQDLAARQDGERVETLRDSLKETMWNRVGIVREAEGLQQALEEIIGLQERYRRISLPTGRGLQGALKLGNMLLVSEMICRSALFRRESRGAHFRRDFPEQNDREWFCNVSLAKTEAGMELGTGQVRDNVLPLQG